MIVIEKEFILVFMEIFLKSAFIYAHSFINVGIVLWEKYIKILLLRIKH